MPRYSVPPLYTDSAGFATNSPGFLDRDTPMEPTRAAGAANSGYSGLEPRPYPFPQQQQSMQQTTLPPMQAGSSGGNMGNAYGGIGGGGQQKISLGQIGLTFDSSRQGGGGGYNLSTFAEGGSVNKQNAPGIAGLNAGNMGFMHPAMGGESRGEQLREIDIINSYFKQSGVPPQQSLKILQSAVRSGVKFERSGNTMMGFKIIPPMSAQIYFFSIDNPQDFAKSVNQLLDSLKKYGVQSVYLNKIDPTIIQALESSGAALQQSDKPEYKVMASI